MGSFFLPSGGLRLPLRLAFVLAAATFVSWAPSASAYCRTTACPGPDGTTVEGVQCVPRSDEDCPGLPVRWQDGCAGFTIQRDGSDQVDYETIRDIMLEAFATWEAVDCGGGQTPSIRVDFLGHTECDRLDFNQKTGGNANTIIFQDAVWPHEERFPRANALTSARFITAGVLADVEIEFNSARYTFSVQGEGVGPDLRSVALHEAGHFLGLAHSEDPTSVMTPALGPQQTARILQPDDIAGICAIYPPEEDNRSCDSTPRGGLQTQCGEAPPAEACSCRTFAGRAPGVPWVYLALAWLWATRRSPKKARAPNC